MKNVKNDKKTQNRVERIYLKPFSFIEMPLLGLVSDSLVDLGVLLRDHLLIQLKARSLSKVIKI